MEHVCNELTARRIIFKRCAGNDIFIPAGLYTIRVYQGDKGLYYVQMLRNGTQYTQGDVQAMGAFATPQEAADMAERSLFVAGAVHSTMGV